MLQSIKLLGKTILATMFLFKHIVTVRKALSYFTNKVTISLFNSVEKLNKNGLTQILPALYRDLSGKTELLKRVQSCMDTHSNRQTIPINRNWQVLAT